MQIKDISRGRITSTASICKITSGTYGNVPWIMWAGTDGPLEIHGSVRCSLARFLCDSILLPRDCRLGCKSLVYVHYTAYLVEGNNLEDLHWWILHALAILQTRTHKGSGHIKRSRSTDNFSLPQKSYTYDGQSSGLTGSRLSC
jgi:hypothetical protein